VPIVLDEPKHPVSVALRAFADQYIVNASTPSPLDPGGSDRLSQSSSQPKAHRRLFGKSVRP